MTTDDLVERVALVFWETPGTPDDRLRAAIALALEEAAQVAEQSPIADYDVHFVSARKIATAIRAMIGKEPA